MTPPVLSKYRTYLIIALIAFFAILAFWIRMIPAMQIGNQDILSFVGSDDPLYNLRQVELMLANFPTYAWWEPMTLFPYGTDLYWGPLTTYIAATLSLLVGATTQPEIIFASLTVPPLMAAVMVPVMFLLGRRLSDWKGGLVAAGLIAVIAGQYLLPLPLRVLRPPHDRDPHLDRLLPGLYPGGPVRARQRSLADQ